jgi:hypothetical protein
MKKAGSAPAVAEKEKWGRGMALETVAQSVSSSN